MYEPLLRYLGGVPNIHGIFGKCENVHCEVSGFPFCRFEDVLGMPRQGGLKTSTFQFYLQVSGSDFPWIGHRV